MLYDWLKYLLQAFTYFSLCVWKEKDIADALFMKYEGTGETL